MAQRSASGRRDASTALVLTINCGSSSLKFALYDISRTGGRGSRERLRYTGSVERIGEPHSAFHVADGKQAAVTDEHVTLRDQSAALRYALDWLEQHLNSRGLDAIGHRIVHGGERYSQPQRVTADVLAELRRLAPLAPLHLPVEIAAIEMLEKRYPTVPQVACFDTAFHRTMPRVAQLYGLPRHLLDAGILRYGFHGLSYEYILSELEREAEAAHTSLNGLRIVIAHLGNGASMAAVRDGHSLDTTMGLTPIGGLVMSTRSGDLDPGVLLYLHDAEKIDPGEMRKSVEQTGGLLGVSGSSGDMQDLLARMDRDNHAAEAVALFCYSARKHLGALIGALGGIDTLVFTGGIGEHAPEVRHRICGGFDFLGIELDDARNTTSEPIISKEQSRVSVRVIHTNEEVMIARHTLRALHRA
jgi:acetate kinase